MNTYIFREYDIRGLVKEDLDHQTVSSIGKAFGTFIARKGGSRVAVGHDVRESSPELSECLIEGIRSTGVSVADMGLVPTPVHSFSIIHYQTDGGLMVTGSHNPREYNGFKMSYKTQSIYGNDIRKIRTMIESGDFKKGDGDLENLDPIPAYMDTLLSRIKSDKPLRVVLDAGNGCASEIAPELFRRLGCEVIPLFCEYDGTFPNHLADPTIPDYMRDLKKKVLKKNADLGIGYDGDADRIGAIDEKGNLLWGDQLMAIFSRDLLSRHPGSPIVFDVKCSQALIEDIEAHGGIPQMWKTGHSLIKARMKELNAPLGGEMSGHIFFSDDYYGFDDAIYASLRLYRLLAASDKPLSEHIETIPKYISTPEIRMDCPDEEKFELVQRLSEAFSKEYDTITIDGVRILFEGGWALIRASNTQPTLVLRFEAKTIQRLVELKDIVRSKLCEFKDTVIF